MTIRINEDWGNVERKAVSHENQFLPVKPVPPPTAEQALAFALTDLAKCKARLHRHEQVFAEALMWLQMGETERTKQLLIQGWASL